VPRIRLRLSVPVAADVEAAKAAQSLGMSRATIYRKIHQYGIITPAS
jgi:transcriptional regulator of acetoin/glycerol metabolism